MATFRATRLGRWLRAIRAIKGHTQEEAGAAMGASAWTVGMWESGGTPSLQGLLAIRKYAEGVIGVDSASLDDLAEWAREPVEVTDARP